MDIPLKQLKGLLKTLEEGGVSEFEYEDKDTRIKLRIGHAPAPVVGAYSPSLAPPAPSMAPPASSGAGQAATAADEDADVVFVTSPFVGTFYRAASPEAEPFAELGAAVRKGQTLCIVEAMKLMNEIESEHAGTVLEVLLENGQSVEFGQKLFKLKKA